MKCLHCRGPMRPVLGGIKFHECPACDAQFFARGDLSAFLQEGGRSFPESSLRAMLEPPTLCRRCQMVSPGEEDCPTCGHALGVRCPRDGQRMMTVRTDAFHIDLCPTCAAIWLDGNELRRIFDHLEANPAESPDLDLVPMAAPLMRPCDVCGVDKPAAHTELREGVWRCGPCRHDEHVADAARLDFLAAEGRDVWVREAREARRLRKLKPLLNALTFKFGSLGD